jgi:hypothetical protein
MFRSYDHLQAEIYIQTSAALDGNPERDIYIVGYYDTLSLWVPFNNSWHYYQLNILVDITNVCAS